MATFVPTTIIGLGTSGSRTLAWLSRLLYQEFGTTIPPFIRLVALDTAGDSLAAEQFAFSIESRAIDTHAPIDIAWERLREAGIAEWFPVEAKRRVQEQDTSKGAGNVRAVGRMCLWANIQTGIFSDSPAEGSKQPWTAEKLRAAAAILEEKLKTPVVPQAPPREGAKDGTHYITDSHHQYYVVGSATGGTASGSIVDLIHLAASMGLPNNGSTSVVALVTLPPETLQGMEALGVNAAATLIDLADMALRPGSISETVHRYPHGRAPSVRAESPAAAVYLLGPSAPGSRGAQMVFEGGKPGDIQEGLAMINAYWLYASLFGLGSELGARVADYAAFLGNAGDTRPWPAQNHVFRTFSLSGAARPTWLLAELVTKRLLEQQILRWTTAEEARLQTWRQQGRDWFDNVIDKELGELAVAIDKANAATRVRVEKETGTLPYGLDAFRDDAQGRHSNALGRAKESSAGVQNLLRTKIAETSQREYSLLAAQTFLAGVEDAIKSRAAAWEGAGIDTSGRDPSIEGSARLVNLLQAPYRGSPPRALGGPNKEELTREMSADISEWLAAHYLAPQYFAASATSSGKSVLAALMHKAAELRSQQAALGELRTSWETRERGIINIDSKARGTVSLVWFHEGDQPAAAADKVVARMAADGDVDSQLKDSIGDLSVFLGLPTRREQEERLLAQWTGLVVLPKTREIVREVSLAETRAAKANGSLLLALNPNYSSRKYFSPRSGSAFLKPQAMYHITSSPDATDGDHTQLEGGQHQLLKDLDVKYEEAAGFTLFDIDHFRTWLARLLRTANALGETDPYQGIRRHLRDYVETTIRFIRDMLFEWDPETGQPTKVWAQLRSADGSILRVEKTGDVADAVIYLGGKSLSVGSGWAQTVQILAADPTRFQALVEALQQSLNTTDGDSIRARWNEVEPRITKRYPGEDVNIRKLQIQYGVDGPTGDVAHLHSRY